MGSEHVEVEFDRHQCVLTAVRSLTPTAPERPHSNPSAQAPSPPWEQEMRSAVTHLHAAANAHHEAVQAADRLNCTRTALAASTGTLQLAAVRLQCIRLRAIERERTERVG
jgi:hypothetical protein